MKERAAPTKQLEAAIGYRFRRRRILRQSLTHKSYTNENNRPPFESNERLEFLGDAVLDLVVSERLMALYSTLSEGQLSKTRAGLVNEKRLAALARTVGLGPCLLLGRGEEKSGGRDKPSVLADAFEALLAAIYVDGGLSRVTRVIRRHFDPLLSERPSEAPWRDFKTQLQERCHSLGITVPGYRLVRATGPDHGKTFEVELRLRGAGVLRASGRTKKEAEQRAAELALGKPLLQVGEESEEVLQEKKKKKKTKKKTKKKKKRKRAHRPPESKRSAGRTAQVDS